MTTFTASDLISKPKHMGQYGEGNILHGKVVLAAAATADIIRPLIIPAGTEVSGIILANDDLDSNGSPTIVFGAGYTPVSANDGALAASAAFFAAAGQTQLQAASSGVLYAKFDPIKFEQDVFLDLLLGTGAATFAAGTLWARVIARNVGVK